MAEMADAADLKSAGAILVGSSPAPGTAGVKMAWFVIIIGYVLGSLPTAYLAGRLRGKDIRQMGDENAGAANAFRELGPAAGVMVGIIDAAKGAVVILIAQAANMPQVVVLCTGAIAVIGHNWSVFLGFRGGRGVSTTIGILLVLVTIPVLVLALPTLLILILKRNVTPSMAFLFIALPLVDWWFKVPALLVGYGIALPALVGVTHFFKTRPKELRQV
jgi:acyl phosphate:glycerol-3-phosphate acyltransferase